MESKYETSEKYVYANIRIPILVNSDDELEPLADYLTLEFEPCDALPEKPKQGVDYSVILEKLRELLQPSSEIQEELDELELEKEEEQMPISNDGGVESEDKTIEATIEAIIESVEETVNSHNEDEPEPITEKKEEPLALPIVVRPDEIKRSKHRKSLKHNYSAKSRSTSKKMKNLTMRSRKEIADTIVTALDRVFGSSPPQEAQEQAQEDGQ
jgi:hypothetical protein